MSAPTSIAWTAPSPAGPLDITINLAKPEKDPRAIARAAQARPEAGEAGAADAAGATGGTAPRPSCPLCWEPDGAGSARLVQSGDAGRTVELAGETWAWWFSPYGYFPEHLIASAPTHRPMAIDHDTVRRLLDFADAYPQWFIGSNADLPIVGGSILGHDHFQGGGYRFPLMKAPVISMFALSGLPEVKAGIVRWPASVVRLRTGAREALLEAACRVMDAWRPFSFAPCAIEAFSLASGGAQGAPGASGDDGAAPSRAGDAAARERFVQHNTLNPILWREDGDYVMDLVLRNNRTTPERPFGLFHVPERLFHIKKENIGLIEIMGRAILPGRLAAELPGIKDECGRAFYEILQATGVFKDDEAGRAGWDALIATM